MKSKNPELSQRYLTLLRIDAANLFNRIKERQNEYVEEFSLKRDRDIFREIFFTRYKESTFFDLSHLPLEVIEVANDFYQNVDELNWYLRHTQDMPNTIEDEIIRSIHILARKHQTLEDYINAELSGRPVIVDLEPEAFVEEDFVEEELSE